MHKLSISNSWSDRWLSCNKKRKRSPIRCRTICARALHNFIFFNQWINRGFKKNLFMPFYTERYGRYGMPRHYRWSERRKKKEEIARLQYPLHLHLRQKSRQKKRFNLYVKYSPWLSSRFPIPKWLAVPSQPQRSFFSALSLVNMEPSFGSKRIYLYIYDDFSQRENRLTCTGRCVHSVNCIECRRRPDPFDNIYFGTVNNMKILTTRLVSIYLVSK